MFTGRKNLGLLERITRTAFMNPCYFEGKLLGLWNFYFDYISDGHRISYKFYHICSYNINFLKYVTDVLRMSMFRGGDSLYNKHSTP